MHAPEIVAPSPRVRAGLAAALAVALVVFAGGPAAGDDAGVEAASGALLERTPGETRALLVVQNGKVLLERYRPGFDAGTRFVSWSMAKSVTALALGVLVDEGKLKLDEPAPIALWQRAGDPRGAITLRHLLNMSAGLAHQEAGEGGRPIQNADTVRILFTDAALDSASHATTRPLEHPPGVQFKYSTATTHIIAEIVTDAVAPGRAPAERRASLAAWFAERFWRPLGITTAEWDFDASGRFLGGSLLHMTARDWSRLGELMLARGVAPDGRRIVSSRWIDIMTTKAPALNTEQYGGHVWLNRPPREGQPQVLFHPRGGDDTYAMVGHLGQYVVVVPSKAAVVVRLGKTANVERGPLRNELGRLIDALPTRRKAYNDQGAAAFETAYARLARRIDAFPALPLEHRPLAAHHDELRAIGRLDEAAP
jgi:CubicO group peptidase (beta-lactamase class C family)